MDGDRHADGHKKYAHCNPSSASSCNALCAWDASSLEPRANTYSDRHSRVIWTVDKRDSETERDSFDRQTWRRACSRVSVCSKGIAPAWAAGAVKIEYDMVAPGGNFIVDARTAELRDSLDGSCARTNDPVLSAWFGCGLLAISESALE